MKSKINVLVPWTPGCGIMEYWIKINEKLKKHLSANIIKNTNPSTINPLYFFKLAQKSKKCDLLHVHLNYNLFGSLFSKINGLYIWLYYSVVKFPKGPKIITTFHDIVVSEKINIFERAYLEFMNLPVKVFSDGIITHNESARDELVKQGFNRDIIRIIPSGLDDLRPKKGKKELRKELNIPDKDTVVLFGWIRADKQYEKVINVLDRLPNTQLLIIGGCGKSDMPYLDFLKQEVAKKKLEKRVIFTGIVPETKKWKLISCGDVVVFPYARSTSSAALMDALSVHLPTISSKLPHFVESESKWGVVRTVNVNSENKLIKTIENVIKNPDELVKSIKQFMAKNDRNEVARLTSKAYNEVVNGK